MKKEFLAYSDFLWFGAIYADEFWEATKNDIEIYLEKIPFDQITVPTHIMHGDMDKDVDFINAEKAHAGIKGSILVKQENGDHNTNYHPDYHAKQQPE